MNHPFLQRLRTLAVGMTVLAIGTTVHIGSGVAQAAEPAMPAPSSTTAPTAPAAKPNKPQPVRDGVAQCGGALPFGQITSCASISGEEPDVFLLEIKKAPEKLLIQFTSSSEDGYVWADLWTPNGEHACSVGNHLTCELSAAGTYQLKVAMAWGRGSGLYSIAAESMRTPSACTKLTNQFFGFDSPGITATMPAGAAAHCYRFDQEVGSVLRIPGYEVRVTGYLVNAELQHLCQLGSGSPCTLTGPGPFWLFPYAWYGEETAYTMRLPRLSNSAGCPKLVVGTFGETGSGTVTQQVASGIPACHKLRVESAGRVTPNVVITDGDLWWAIHDDAGRMICYKYSHDYACELPTAGAYTLVVDNRGYSDPVTYHVAVVALTSDTGCAAPVSTAWDLPAIPVRQKVAGQITCQPFVGSAGDRVMGYAQPVSYNGVASWLVNAAGEPVCSSWYDNGPGCVLPASGTYRVLTHLRHWYTDGSSTEYKTQIRLLNNATGCPVVRPGAYGAAPAGPEGGIRCRVLEAPAEGTYILKPVDARNYEQAVNVFDSAGRQIECGTTFCPLPAGRFTMVIHGAVAHSVIDNDLRYATAFLSTTPSGCASASDGGNPIVAHRGEFGTAGQVDCVQLSSSAGAKLTELLPGNTPSDARPDLTIVDATGRFICDHWSLRFYSCEMTGTAPFFAVTRARAEYPAGPYAVALLRLNSPTSCPVLPQGAPGATVTTSATQFAACFSIPADQHAARETFTFKRTSGDGLGMMLLYTDSGYRTCGTTQLLAERTFTCTVPEGPVTVVFEAYAGDGTYQLTRTPAS